MVLCVSNEKGDIELMRPSEGAKVGERVVLEGVEMG